MSAKLQVQLHLNEALELAGSPGRCPLATSGCVCGWGAGLTVLWRLLAAALSRYLAALELESKSAHVQVCDEPRLFTSNSLQFESEQMEAIYITNKIWKKNASKSTNRKRVTNTN